MSLRLCRSLALLTLAAALAVAAAAPTLTSAASSPHRLGGHVRHAWPAKGSPRPKTAIARWLARQVGPRNAVSCTKRPAARRARCAARRGRASASTVSRPVAVAAATAKQQQPSESIQLLGPNTSRPLQLIRSFDIPVGDPSYDRLLNWSWTYDSAVAATAFASVGLRDQAGRLLDQLAALQRKNGSIEFAFDVKRGESTGTIRSGSIGFAAIAFTDYDATFGDARYLDNARRAADYLLSLRTGDGLVRGGPDVKWISTQHNVIALIALTRLAEQLQQQGDDAGAATYRDAAEGIAKGIDSQLIVHDDGGLAHFREGVGDDVVPLDTQALGVIYAIFRRDEDLAKQVYEFAQQSFAVADRSIELSKKPATYNMSYQAAGPFTGYRPYLGKQAPDVLWFEGTAEMRLVSTALGQPTDELDASMNAWWRVTRKQGLAPLGADRTVTGNAYNEYHVWPTAAAGAWTVLSGAASDVEWTNPPPAD
jgi:hypothetical protein